MYGEMHIIRDTGKPKWYVYAYHVQIMCGRVTPTYMYAHTDNVWEGYTYIYVCTYRQCVGGLHLHICMHIQTMCGRVTPTYVYAVHMSPCMCTILLEAMNVLKQQTDHGI